VGRKEDLRRQIERAEKELAKLNAMPDLDAMNNGTVVVAALAYARSPQPYVYVGLKEGGRWYFTGRGPHKATADEVIDFFATGTRKLMHFDVLGKVEVVRADVIELDATLLNAVREYPGGRRVSVGKGEMYVASLSDTCMIPDCGCIGAAHP
jgi:hypothetical protein